MISVVFLNLVKWSSGLQCSIGTGGMCILLLLGGIFSVSDKSS